MRVGNRLGAAAVVLMLGAAAARSGTWDFEADAVGKPAKGFTAEVGRWEVAQDGGNRVLAQRAENANRVYNVALVEGTSYKDLDVSIRVKPRTRQARPGGRPGLEGEGQGQLLHREVQPAGGQLPALPRRERPADPTRPRRRARRPRLAHASDHDEGSRHHRLARREEAARR